MKITTYLSPIDAVFGLTATLFSGLSLLYMMRENRRKYRRWRREALHTRGLRPGALLVDLHRKGTVTQMHDDAMAQLKSKNLQEQNIVQYVKNGELNSSDLPQVVAGIRNAIAELSRRGVDDKYVYCSAPFPVVMILGAELANAGGVHLIHRNTTSGAYENWGFLRHPV